jgi:core binding factor beta subunit
MDELVQRLSTGEHPVEISVRPERTAKALKERIDDGYVHVKFTNTRGGTELGVTLDKAASDIAIADFENGAGRITLVGSLKLNYVRVRCIAQIDLSTMNGVGHLEVADSAVS